MNNQWLTIKEAAGYLRLSLSGMRKYIREGKVPTYRLGRVIRLKRADLDNLFSPETRSE